MSNKKGENRIEDFSSDSMYSSIQAFKLDYQTPTNAFPLHPSGKGIALKESIITVKLHIVKDSKGFFFGWVKHCTASKKFPSFLTIIHDYQSQAYSGKSKNIQ